MSDSYDRQKEQAGSWATIVWIASGLFLYLTSESASLFSWSAVIFFVVGMFAAAIVFGIAFYLIQRGIAKLLLTLIKEPTPRVASIISSIGWVLLAIETVVIYLVASWVFRSYVLGS